MIKISLLKYFFLTLSSPWWHGCHTNLESGNFFLRGSWWKNFTLRSIRIARAVDFWCFQIPGTRLEVQFGIRNVTTLKFFFLKKSDFQKKIKHFFRESKNIFGKLVSTFFSFRKIHQYSFLLSYWTPSNSFWSRRTSDLSPQKAVWSVTFSSHSREFKNSEELSSLVFCRFLRFGCDSGAFRFRFFATRFLKRKWKTRFKKLWKTVEQQEIVVSTWRLWFRSLGSLRSLYWLRHLSVYHAYHDVTQVTSVLPINKISARMIPFTIFILNNKLLTQVLELCINYT